MAQIIRVARARVRYPMKPQLDSDGNPVISTIYNSHGEPRTRKDGTPTVRPITVRDYTKDPLPNFVCEHCGTEILVGKPYKHITTRAGGERVTRYRCSTCPDWNPWDISNALSAQIARLTVENSLAVTPQDTSPEPFRDRLNATRAHAATLGVAKRESAEAIRVGFSYGRPSPHADSIDAQAQALEKWSTDLAAAAQSVPDYPASPKDRDAWMTEVATLMQVIADGPDLPA